MAFSMPLSWVQIPFNLMRIGVIGNIFGSWPNDRGANPLSALRGCILIGKERCS